MPEEKVSQQCENCHGDPCTCPHGWPETDNKTVQISEGDLRGVFGHKCDQPNCPICHPDMSLTEWAELYERAATPRLTTVAPPAADAGPRQCGKFMTRVNNSWDMLCNAASGHEPPCSFTMPISMPPAPQEAAPRPLVSVNEPRFNCSECGSSVAESYRSQHVCESAPDICVCGTERNPIGYCKVCDKFYSRPQSAPAPDSAMRQDEPLKALRQWEADTEAPANASEGNAFIDGFNAGREAGSERERELARALNNLKCEVVGWLGLARPMLVRELSVTNVRVMEHQVAEASRLLGGES